MRKIGREAGLVLVLAAMLFGPTLVAGPAARGATPSAFERRCIPPGCVAPPSNTPGMLGRRALPAGRIAALGATMDLHHGLLGRGAQPPGGGFPDLVGALKATPGCIGVETARTASGKQVIFAWFENKKAVLTWYYSDTHMSVKNQFAPGSTHTPLADVPDEGQPVLAIASLTLTGAPTGDVASLPISQIAIELYRPLPGGLAAGGRFAPSALKVPGMQIVPLTGQK